MPRVRGFLHIMGLGHPDHGLPPGFPGAPDQGLPGEPDYPDQGLPDDLYPDQGLPAPPPGVWPPLSPTHPIAPAPPDTPPGAIWPPIGKPPNWPSKPEPEPEPPIGLPEKFWVVAGIPGVGWRYVCVDTSLIPQPK